MGKPQSSVHGSDTGLTGKQSDEGAISGSKSDIDRETDFHLRLKSKTNKQKQRPPNLGLYNGKTAGKHPQAFKMHPPRLWVSSRLYGHANYWWNHPTFC